MFQLPSLSNTPTSDLLVLGLAFLASFASVIVFAGVLFCARRRDPDPDHPAPPFFGPLNPILAALIPMSASGREKLRTDLLRAGHFEPIAPENFSAMRAVLLYFPLLAGLIPAAIINGEVAVAYFSLGLAFGILGYAMPRVFLAVQADRREDEVRRGLPMLMDTMGLTLSTGAALASSLSSSGEAVRRGYPELAREVRVVGAQGRLRSLSHALDQWKDRMTIPELGSFVFLLSQADRQGADVTRGLWELSASLQVNARQRAEAAANRTSFFSVFPTVLCLLLAAGLMLGGPGFVHLVESNKKVEQILDEAAEQEQLIKEEQEDFLAPPSSNGGLQGVPLNQ